MELGRDEDAIPWLLEATRARRYEAPQSPRVNLARIHEQRGDALEAVAEYGRAAERVPGYGPAIVGMRRQQQRVN